MPERVTVTYRRVQNGYIITVIGPARALFWSKRKKFVSSSLDDPVMGDITKAVKELFAEFKK